MTVEGMKVGDIGRVRERERDRKRERARERRAEKEQVCSLNLGVAQTQDDAVAKHWEYRS